MLSINDLPESQELDRQALTDISGGYFLPSAFADVDVNIGINQEINQLQNVEVAALNNIGVLGADLGPLNFNVSPSQWASNQASTGRGNPFAL
jgi:hypothetical protein